MMIRIGTRGSHLARTQSTTIARQIQKLGHETELVIINTSGDQSNATSFGSIGPQGVFVREIEQSLLDHKVDMAVHSYKDLPTKSPEELLIAAVPARLDAADVLVMRKEVVTENQHILSIIQGGKIGTASARRQAWLKHLRPDITVKPIRGNVPTRIAKLKKDFDGIILAAAGLERLKNSRLDDAPPQLSLDKVIVQRIAPEVFVPAPAQGALALQCHRASSELKAILQTLDHSHTRQCVNAERILLSRLEGGCDLAFGAYASTDPLTKNAFNLIALIEHEGEHVFSKENGTNLMKLVETVWHAFEQKLR
jgi:hydroxymethylbilane synthase